MRIWIHKNIFSLLCIFYMSDTVFIYCTDYKVDAQSKQDNRKASKREASRSACAGQHKQTSGVYKRIVRNKRHSRLYICHTFALL